MNKVDFALDLAKQALKVVEDLHQLADSIQAICSIVTSELSVEANKEQPKEVAKKPTITLEKVRGVLAEKSQAGYTSEVKAIITSHGANRLSEISPDDYASILQEAEALGND